MNSFITNCRICMRPETLYHFPGVIYSGSITKAKGPSSSFWLVPSPLIKFFFFLLHLWIMDLDFFHPMFINGNKCSLHCVMFLMGWDHTYLLIYMCMRCFLKMNGTIWKLHVPVLIVNIQKIFLFVLINSF